MTISVKAIVATVVFLTLQVARAAGAPADSELAVQIVDPSGGAVAAARVAVYSRARSDPRTTTTDREGRAVFAGLTPGEYLVDVEAQGFVTVDAARVTLESETSRLLSLTLSVGGFKSHIVVTASNGAERLDDVSKTVSLVDLKEIDARDIYTIGDAVRTVPGARVEQLGGPGSQTSIRLRGLRSQDTAVLIDGVPFRDLSATQGDATSFISDLLLTNVDRVEVLRGSGSDLYGSNAIGGAVNVISRSGGGRTSGEGRVEGGGLGAVRAHAHGGGSRTDGRLAYSGGASALNVVHGVDGDDRAWNTSVQGRVTSRLGSATLSALAQGVRALTAVNATPVGIGTLPAVVTLSAIPLTGNPLRSYETGLDVSRLDRGLANFIPSANDPDSRRRSGSSVAVLQIAHQMTNRVEYSASYHRVSTSRRFSNGPRGAGFQPAGVSRSDFDGGIDTFEIRSHAVLPTGHLVTFGYQLERERYASLSLPGNPIQQSAVNVSEQSQTASAQDRIQLFEGSLHLTVGLRAHFFSLRTPEFTPITTAPYQDLTFQAPPSAYTGDGSVAYVISSTRTKLRVHMGTGYRAPSLYERFGTSFGSDGYSIYGDPRLGPERSVAGDAGIDQEFARGHARLSLSLFRTDLDHLIVFDSSGVINRATDPFGRASGYRTSAEGHASGVELSARTEPASWLLLDGSYTFHAEPSTDSTNTVLAFGLPRHQASFRAVSHVGSRLQACAVFTAASTHLAPISDAVTFISGTYRFDGMRRLDLSASYALPLPMRRDVRVVGHIDNVTNQTYFESGFRTPGRVASGGVAIEF